MRFRTWPVAALGLGGLLALVAISLLTASHRAQDIYTELDQLNTYHREVEAKFRRLRSDIHLSGILIRDYLLDTQPELGSEYRTRVAEYRRTNLATFKELRALARRDGWDDHRTEALQIRLDDYWRVYEPLFDWKPAERLNQSALFLRTEVIPRREAVLTLAREIEDLNNANLAAQRAEVTRRQDAFRSDLRRLLWQSLLLGLVVAVSAVVRLSVLERRSEEQREIAEQAEREMRRLSAQLVATQEEERKKLSRELHDHIGQMLTALRLEIGRIDRLHVPAGTAAGEAVVEARQIVDKMVHTVRDLALGLRPSMLDDFGLQPALEWHVRDFTRRCGLDVDLTIAGNLDGLPDPHRTCVYRTVQEALTNCVRHARATRVDIRVTATDAGLDVSIADNGVGMDDPPARTGLGLRGIEERARDLDGTLTIGSTPGGGTALTIHIPYVAPTSEVPLARAAG